MFAFILYLSDFEFNLYDDLYYHIIIRITAFLPTDFELICFVVFFVFSLIDFFL